MATTEPRLTSAHTPLSPILTYRSQWTPQTTHANGHANGTPYTPTFDQPSNVHSDDSCSFSAISLRAALLGTTFGLSFSLTLHLLTVSSPLWRASFFLATLSLFHFLEFYITATYNPSVAGVSAFLLSQNGSAYNIAHGLAFLETVLTHSLLPYPDLLPSGLRYLGLVLGLLMLGVGQGTRSVAMAQAGSNFNHTVQQQRKSGHELVTRGLYGVLRHPSYFGFWWWGLGTQMVLGNAVCFVGYAVVLWRFFSGRIEKEEELLVRFFGEEYVEYRERTTVGIPFIR